MKLLFSVVIILFYENVLCNGLVHDATVNRSTAELLDLYKTNLEDGVQWMVPGVIRLLFHDCVDGCDACLNVDLIPNRGLNKTINALEPIYLKYAKWFSRPDFWAIAGKAAFALGVENNNKRCSEPGCMTPPMNIRFLHGRKPCPTSPYHSEDTSFPSPLQGSKELFAWFKKTFGFSPNNVAAVMGMHTLGRVRSPFNSSWEKDNQDGIGIKYFQKLADPYHNWVQESIPKEESGLDHDVYKWVSKDLHGFALPVDVALVKNLKLNPMTGESNCTYYTCSRSVTYGMFLRYADSAKTWVHHMQWLFPRIIEKGGFRLRWPSKAPICLDV